MILFILNNVFVTDNSQKLHYSSECVDKILQKKNNFVSNVKIKNPSKRE